jgi:hypothetical protein
MKKIKIFFLTSHHSCAIINLTNEREVNKMNYYIKITARDQAPIIIIVGESGKAYDVYADTCAALKDYALVELVDGDSYVIVCSSDEK